MIAHGIQFMCRCIVVVVVVVNTMSIWGWCKFAIGRDSFHGYPVVDLSQLA